MASWAEQLELELAGRGLAVASVPGKGRSLVAGRSFFPGEVIISQEPYASTPNKISVGSGCDHCFATGHLRKCSVCRVAWYCGSACQVIGTFSLRFITGKLNHDMFITVGRVAYMRVLGEDLRIAVIDAVANSIRIPLWTLFFGISDCVTKHGAASVVVPLKLF